MVLHLNNIAAGREIFLESQHAFSRVLLLNLLNIWYSYFATWKDGSDDIHQLTIQIHFQQHQFSPLMVLSIPASGPSIEVSTLSISRCAGLNVGVSIFSPCAV